MSQAGRRQRRRATPRDRLVAAVHALGPGVVSGAADDDPSGIATYSQAGAQFGFGLLWTALLTTPFMIAIQLAAARVGRVTGLGLAGNLRAHWPRHWADWIRWCVAAALVRTQRKCARKFAKVWNNYGFRKIYEYNYYHPHL